jgi:enoyl-CoA hydratase/carnithine racemase
VSELVKYEKNGQIVTITLDNPPVNAVSTKVLKALNAAFDRAEKEDEARVIIFAGEGPKAFCAGGDMREEKDFGDPETARAFRTFGRETLNRIENGKLPVIAAIHGYCIGGGTALGWVCDIRIAADNAVFRAGDAYLGLVPSWGMGLTRLPRLVGRNRVLDILLIGENFDAAKAHEFGLVTKVVPRAGLMQEARAVADRIAKASPSAILATRKAVAYNLRHGWDEMVRYEEEICTEVFGHPDAHEGPKAFTEKRPPSFKSL